MKTDETVWWRRGQAIKHLRVSEESFTKLIKAGTIVPRYFPGLVRAFYLRSEVEGLRPGLPGKGGK